MQNINVLNFKAPSFASGLAPADSCKPTFSVNSCLQSSNFDVRSETIQGMQWPKEFVGPSKPCPYAVVSHALELIESFAGTGSRGKTVTVLSNLFRFLIWRFPTNLVPAVYLLLGKVAPDYENTELGVGDQIITRAMCAAFGRTEADISSSLNKGEASDLGEVALLSRVKQAMLMPPAPLSVPQVFKDLRKMAETKGKDSTAERKEIIQKLLVSSRNSEAKFIVRTLQGRLRVGIQDLSIIASLAHAFTLTHGTVADSRLEKSDNALAPSASVVEERIAGMEEAVKQAVCEVPNYEHVIGVLMKVGPDAAKIKELCTLKPGVPIKPMLAKPTKSFEEVSERFDGRKFTAEYKYDGERAQIHVFNRDESGPSQPGAIAQSGTSSQTNFSRSIEIYSRNSEKMTEKYPDVVEAVKQQLSPSVESMIVDSEIVAVKKDTGELLSFQAIQNRARKGVKEEDIKIAVSIFPFDVMFYNGTSLISKTLRQRREVLHTLFTTKPGVLTFANGKDIGSQEELEAFLTESVESKCEGLMLKALDVGALYEPSKRSLNWLKVKKDYVDGMGDSVDLVPIGAYYGKGKRSGVFGAYLLAVYDATSGGFQTVCKAGTGFSDADLKAFDEFAKANILDKCRIDYEVAESLMPDVWIDATAVWECTAADLSLSPVHSACAGLREDGRGIGLRFPRFLRVRTDKKPEDATNSEQILTMYEEQFQASAKRAKVDPGSAAPDELPDGYLE